MDQTTLENKILLGAKRKRSKGSNMGCYFFVRDCRDCEKKIEYPQLPLRNLYNTLVSPHSKKQQCQTRSQLKNGKKPKRKIAFSLKFSKLDATLVILLL